MIDTPSLHPNPDRLERTIARCHARLATQRRSLEQKKGERIERNLAVGFALVYFTAVTARVITIFATF